MKRRLYYLIALCLALTLSACNGGINPKVCVDTSQLPALGGGEAPKNTQRCGGFVFGVDLGTRSTPNQEVPK